MERYDVTDAAAQLSGSVQGGECATRLGKMRGRRSSIQFFLVQFGGNRPVRQAQQQFPLFVGVLVHRPVLICRLSAGSRISSQCAVP